MSSGLDLLNNSYEYTKDNLSSYNPNRFSSNNSTNSGTNSQVQAFKSLQQVSNTQQVGGVQGSDISGLLDLNIQDTYEQSKELSLLKQIAQADLSNEQLGEVLYDNGLLSAQEKGGFDFILRLNPSLDPNATEQIINNANLSKDMRQTLNTVSNRINAVAYFS